MRHSLPRIRSSEETFEFFKKKIHTHHPLTHHDKNEYTKLRNARVRCLQKNRERRKKSYVYLYKKNIHTDMTLCKENAPHNISHLIQPDIFMRKIVFIYFRFSFI